MTRPRVRIGHALVIAAVFSAAAWAGVAHFAPPLIRAAIAFVPVDPD